MYLGARLIGVGIYLICILWFYFVIPRIRGLKIHIYIYCLLLALMGFFYKPLSGSDLGRIQLSMHAIGSKSVPELINAMMKSSTPLAVLYYYMLSLFNDDRILPFVNAMLTYGLCFIMLMMCKKKFESSKKNIALVVFFFMSRGLLMMTIANIRTMLSLAIVAFSIYKIMIEKKSFLRNFVLMIVGALIHNIGMIALFLFVGFYIVYGVKDRKKWMTFFESLVLLVAMTIYGRSLLLSVVDKGLTYLEYSRKGTGFFYIWEFVLSILVLCATIFLGYKYRAGKKIRFNNSDISIIREKYSYKRFIDFQIFLSIISFFLLFIEFNSGLRLSWLVTILDMPMLIIIFEDEYLKNNRLNIKNGILIWSFIILFIAVTRGDLCSLKFY